MAARDSILGRGLIFMGITNTALTTAGSVSLFGWLDNLPVWRDLPYPIKGAMLRGAKAALSFITAYLLTQIASGTLFPPELNVTVTLMLTTLIQFADKYIREWNIDQTEQETDTTEEIGDVV